MNRIRHEFPLSSSLTPVQSQAPETTTLRLNRLAGEVQSLARELSQDYITQNILRCHRGRIAALRLRLHELQQQPVHIRCIELPRLISEIDQVLSAQRAYTSLGHGKSIPIPSKTSARTIVPILATSTYKEQHEAEFERSLNYVQVQIKILWALEVYDTQLSPTIAYGWTCDIVPKGQWPQPLQALRLCYYMRSLGYDTYASIKTTEGAGRRDKATLLRLLVAKPGSEERGEGYDSLYWIQDIQSGWVSPEPYKLRPGVHVTASTSRPALTLNTSSLGHSDRTISHIDQQAEEIPRLRGGEAVEPFRISRAVDEIDVVRAELRRDLLQANWEAAGAVESDEERLIQAIRQTRRVALPGL